MTAQVPSDDEGFEMSGSVYVHRSGALRRLSDWVVIGHVGWRQIRECEPVNRTEQIGLMMAKLEDFRERSLELLGAPAELDALSPVVLVPLGLAGRVTAMEEEAPGRVLVTIESDAVVREKIARLRLAENAKKGPAA